MRLSISQTPSNTPSNTPTNTNSGTPCPTISLTPSPTPTSCDCFYFDIYVDENDLLISTGNTNPSTYNNTVQVSWFPCDESVLQFLNFTEAGTYENAICVNGQFPTSVAVFYDVNNVPIFSSASTATQQGCCISPTNTPTITPTLTATPTSTIQPTPTNTNTPSPTETIVLTPSVTSTLTPTPTLTPCPEGCCLETITNPAFSSGSATIVEMKLFDDGSLFVGDNAGGGTYNGVPITNANRIPRCGGATGVSGFTGVCANPSTGGVRSIIMAQQSSKYIISTGMSIFRLNSDFTLDTTFNEIRQTNFPTNQVIINGLYVGDSDKIYVVGVLSPSGLTECTGTTYNFNTNIYRLNANGGVDTTYSGITLDGMNFGGIEPSITTEEDINGKCLILSQTGFTGNTAYKNVMRFNPDGTPDNTFDNTAFSAATSIQMQGAYCQTDGKYLVFGSFTNIAGTGRNALVRLNSDGTLDTTFRYSGTSTGTNVQDAEQDKYGNYHILKTGNGNMYQKLDNSGTVILEITWNTGLPLSLLASDCDLFIAGGGFTTISGGTTYTRFLKYDLNGNLNMCVLPTPTPTGTPTQTPTLTRTPTQTPSMTQTQTNTGTLTSTPTNTSTPTRSPEITPSMTQTQTQTNTPSVTPQCQQIFLYPDNTNACDHLNTLTQYDTDSALSPTILYVLGGCGSTPVVGNNLWFSQGASADSYQVDNNGVIINTFTCP